MLYALVGFFGYAYALEATNGDILVMLYNALHINADAYIEHI
jgi:hypothetical protein